MATATPTELTDKQCRAGKLQSFWGYPATKVAVQITIRRKDYNRIARKQVNGPNMSSVSKAHTVPFLLVAYNELPIARYNEGGII